MDSSGVLIISLRKLKKEKQQEKQEDEKNAANGSSHSNQSSRICWHIIIVVILNVDRVGVGVGDILSLSSHDDDIVMFMGLERLTSDLGRSVASDISELEVDEISILLKSRMITASLSHILSERSRVSNGLSSDILRNGGISVGDSSSSSVGESLPVGLETGFGRLLLAIVTTIEFRAGIDSSAGQSAGWNRDIEEQESSRESDSQQEQSRRGVVAADHFVF
jgi:hypothetical protein